MKKLLIFLAVSACAFAQTSNVQKTISSNRLTAGFKVPGGATIQFESGSTFQLDAGAISSVMVDPMTTAGDTIFRNGSNVNTRLPIGPNGRIYTIVSGLPAWVAPSFAASGAIGSSGLTMSTGKLLGRITASTGAVEEITVGSGLTLASGTLSVSGGGSGDVVGPSSATDNALARFDLTTGKLIQDSNVTLADSGTALVFSGEAGITAGGSNQNVTLTPSGTGSVSVQSALALSNSAPRVTYAASLNANSNTLTLQPSTANTAAQVNVAPSGSATDSAVWLFSTSNVDTSSQQAFAFGGGFGGAVSSMWNFGAFVTAGPTATSWPITFLTSNGSGRHQVLTLNTDATIRFNGYGAGSLTTDSSGNVTATSDEQLKSIQGNFTRGLSDIAKLRPILFRWNEKSGLERETTYAGFSAQNVQLAMPEAVGKMQNGYLTIQDRAILAALVNANNSLFTMVKFLVGAMGVLLVAIVWTRKR